MSSTLTDWQKAIDDFLTTLDLRPSTIKYHQDYLKTLLRYLETERFVPMEQFTPAEIVRFFKARNAHHAAAGRSPLSENTKTNYKKTLKKFLAFATEDGQCATNPLAGLKVPMPPRAFVYLPTAEDLRCLFATLKAYWKEPRREGTHLMSEKKKRFYYHHYHALLCLLIDTGVRISEALLTQPGDYCLDGPDPYVTIRHQKGGGYRALPLSSFCVQALNAYLRLRPKGTPHNPVAPELFLCVDGRAYSRKQAQRRLRLYREKAGLHPRCTLHSLRHYFLTEMAEENQKAAQQAAGHADARTTENYAHKRGHHLRAVHAKVSPLGKVVKETAVRTARAGKHRL